MAHINGPSNRTKHLDVRHFYIQQQVLARVLRLTQVPTSEQWADFLTKALCRVLFQRAVRNIGYPNQGLRIIAFIYTFYCHSMLSYEKLGHTVFGLRKITA